MSTKATKIIGLKLISLIDGKELGEIEDLIYDPDEKRIAALIVDKGGWFSEPKIVLIENIKSIGENAIILDSPNVIKNVSQIDSKLSNIAKNETYITHTKIITDAGVELGIISDILFDPTTGQVERFEVSQGGIKDLQSGKKYVDVSSIKTIGKDLIIIKSDSQIENQTPVFQKQFDQSISQVKRGFEDVKEEVKDRDVENKVSNTTENIKEELGQFVNQVKSGVGDLTSTTKEKISETKQDIKNFNKNNVVGRYLLVNLLNREDQFIAKRGDMVTHKIVDEAEANGLLTTILNNVSDKPVE